MTNWRDITEYDEGFQKLTPNEIYRLVFWHPPQNSFHGVVDNQEYWGLERATKFAIIEAPE